VRSVSTASNAWHSLSLEVRGARLTVLVDGQKRFEKTLDTPPQGRLGLWSKADSQVLFDDFEVQRLGGEAPTGKPSHDRGLDP